MGFVVPVTAGSDWHNGYDNIPLGVIVRIVENRQSCTFGVMKIEGCLNLDGSLILEP